MFSNPFFDSIISMIVLYLIFSQLTLSLTELAAGPLNSRGRYLYNHLGTALGPAAQNAFYLAGPIQALISAPEGQNLLMRKLGIERWPAYVSETLFAQTIIAQVSAAAPAPALAGAATPPSAIDQFGAGLTALPATHTQLVALLTPLYTNALAAGTAAEQSQHLQTNLELWFREFGSRMSGWYKRDNRKWLFLAGLVVAVLADVDTLRLVRFLFDSANAKARTALVEVGTQAAHGVAPPRAAFNPTDRVADSVRRTRQQYRLDSAAAAAFRNTLANVPQVGLPLGWLRWQATSTLPNDTATLNRLENGKRVYAKPLPCAWAPSADDYGMPTYAQRWTLNQATGQIGHPAGWSWWRVLGGWLLTAFAMMVGAPFWFDTLCRFVNIRNVGIKPAKATTT